MLSKIKHEKTKDKIKEKIKEKTKILLLIFDFKNYNFIIIIIYKNI